MLIILFIICCYKFTVIYDSYIYLYVSIIYIYLHPFYCYNHYNNNKMKFINETHCFVLWILYQWRGRRLFCQTVMKMRIKVELRLVINTRCMMSPEEEDDDDGACVSAEAKRSRLVSDEDSGSDEGSGAPDKSLAAKLKELGSDSEDEEDTTKRDGGKKNEKALFGSDSDSGDDEEESVMHFIGLSARVCVCV